MNILSNSFVALLILCQCSNWLLPATAIATEDFRKESIISVEDRKMPKLFACDFEVFGKVQGVFFRKYTEKQAKHLGLKGWCMNTMEGTVKGQVEGPQQHLNEMKHWLSNVGSPKSRIEKAVFSEMKEIPEYTVKSFVIKR